MPAPRTLEILEERIANIEKENRRLKAENKKLASLEQTAWHKHVVLPKRFKKTDWQYGLPIPRLDIELLEKGGGVAVGDLGEWPMHWRYLLIYRHFLGDLVGIPMGLTGTDIGGDIENRVTREGIVDTPFRDGVHIVADSKQLGLPAFTRFRHHYSRYNHDAKAWSVCPCSKCLAKSEAMQFSGVMS